MNQIKKDLNDELRSFALSGEKKQVIADRAKSTWRKKNRRSTWSYRFVLAVFTVFTLSFSYLLTQQEQTVNRTQSSAASATQTSTVANVLTNDFSKTLYLIFIFIILRILVKRSLNKKGSDLPICLDCNEEWSFRNALKISMKNGEVICPHCYHKQFRTRKSVAKASMLNLVPFGIIVAQIYTHPLLGFFVYSACAIGLIISISPYLIELQKDDPMNKPLY